MFNAKQRYQTSTMCLNLDIESD